MSLPDPEPPRKLSRRGLYVPFGLLLVAIVAWSGYWVHARAEVTRRLDAYAEKLDAAGYKVRWAGAHVGGYPFRLDVVLTEAEIRHTSGWGMTTPRLEAEAFLHAPTQWVVAAPRGLTLVRPVSGPIAIGGKVIRASLRELDKTPPRFSFEGQALTFTPAAGALPFAISAADRVELHSRPGPDAQAALLFRLDGGKARPGGPLERIGGGEPVSMIWDSRLSQMAALRGADWPAAVRNWTGAGGAMSVQQGGLTVGDATLGVAAGTLKVDASGQLAGDLAVTLRQGPRALATLGETGILPRETALAAAAVAMAREGSGEAAKADLIFQAGRMTLGPVALGPSPRVY